MLRITKRVISVAGVAIWTFGLAFTSIATPVGAGEKVTAEDYKAAATQLEGSLVGLVKNASVEPHWLADGFWYQREGQDGDEYVVFDLSTKKRQLAFDHVRINKAMALDELTEASLSDDLATLTATRDGQRVTCSFAKATCEAAPIVASDPGLLPSPDGRFAIFTRHDDLYLRDLSRAEETRLTRDGKPFYSYGKWPDSALIAIETKKTGKKLPPYASSWSPDGRFVLVPRIDERLLETIPFVEWVPVDGSRRPIVHTVREPLVGERDQGNLDWFIFDAVERKRIPVDLRNQIKPDMFDGGAVGWDLENRKLFLLLCAFAAKEMSVVSVDLTTGQAETVIHEKAIRTRFETNTHFYHKPNVRVVGGGKRIVWYSDQTGWGHLYLYNSKPSTNTHATKTHATKTHGDQLKVITLGEWTVLDILEIDEEKQEIYFTGGGRENGRDPYYRHLYKASLDPSQPTKVTLLTKNDADHHFPPDPAPMYAALFAKATPSRLIRPDLGVFIDTSSTVDQPPVTVLRSTIDGHLLAELERADVTALFETGYQPPVRRSFKAFSGDSEIYSVYYAPQRELPGDKHPVIDAAYGGPQVLVAPKNFIEAFAARNPLGESALSRLGFAVVVTDGRGTPGRSSAFRDAGYPEFTRVGIEDHIAALKQWATRRPEMDLERVGIHGWSWGGTFAAQAILNHPEFYKVAVAGAGVYDYAAIYPGCEAMTGPPVYEDGSRFKTRPDESPANWRKLDITRMAGNLEGKLMLIYGDMDENVPQAQTLRLVSALVDANKPHDLLYLPNRPHAAANEPYTLLRTWDYFVEHLLGVDPPRDVAIESSLVRR